MSQPPLPAETRYWRRGDDRQRVVTALFDRSAAHYDRACRIMAFGSGQAYRREALVRAGVRKGMEVLDVGTGTGLLAREIADLVGPAGRIVGLDPSRGMLAAGRALAIERVQGLGEALPFADGTFDLVTMGYALRHVPDLDQAFAEYRRVLRPGGRVLLLEITRPRSALGLAAARAYFGLCVPLLTLAGTASVEAAGLMRFYWETIAACVPPETVLASLDRARFAGVSRGVVHGIFSEYRGER
ncbi:MAG TPA: class I SAM-dependent methyltransferase [Vicinamibacterales bacterium]|jgi:demethylmenaquinone methyltransferase/2-methoxy-6-polyprenyl-1,4-benzoquinol methylase|nr:class I SAM-dependent methyltransferase [Vicinamibacterales bacterium]